MDALKIYKSDLYCAHRTLSATVIHYNPPLSPSETPGGVYLHVVDDVIVRVLEVVHSNCLQLITSLYRIQCVIRCLLIIC